MPISKDLEAKTPRADLSAVSLIALNPSEFVPALPPVAEKEAQQAILPLTGQYALMRPRK